MRYYAFYCAKPSIDNSEPPLLLLQAASDVYSPVSGEVVEINQALVDEPATVSGTPQSGVGHLLLACWFRLLNVCNAVLFACLLAIAFFAFIMFTKPYEVFISVMTGSCRQCPVGSMATVHCTDAQSLSCFCDPMFDWSFVGQKHHLVSKLC